jgi:hypothetical protein
MALERKSSIRKAPVADVVDVLTSAEKRTETAEQGEASQATVGQANIQTGAAQADLEPRRPGPGRPRGKRRMEPFSSKIEISLRDELDAYSTKYGITITDLLDEALRERLRRK